MHWPEPMRSPCEAGRLLLVILLRKSSQALKRQAPGICLHGCQN